MAHTSQETLLERDGELAVLRELVASAADGAGTMVFIEGPAGIGKSGLLREAQATARDAGLTTAGARGSELEREFAFGLVRQLYEPLLSGISPKRRKELFGGAAGLARPLFEALDADALSPREEAGHAALHGLHWLTVNLVGDGPLALVVDDAHWGDAPSLRFLAYLLNRVDELPVFLAVGARPSEPGAEAELLDELATTPSTRLIYPLPLTAAAVDRQLRLSLDPDPDRSFSEACFEATKGNPLFLRELLVSLNAEGVAPTAAQAGRVLEMAPHSVARSVARRVRRLASEAGELARAIAVLGDGADLPTAARLAGLDADAAAGLAEALAQADILSLDRLEFVHPVVRAAIYSELSPIQRARQHRAAAAVLSEAGADEDEIALHVLAAEPSDDQWVVALLRRAARRAHARGAPDVAATYLQRALSEPPPADARVDLLVELGFAEGAAVRTSGLARTWEALELAEDPHTRARVALELGRSLFMWGDLPEAARVFEEALAELGASDPELRQALEAQLIGACLPVPSLTPRILDRVEHLWEERAQLSDPVLLAALAPLVASTQEPAHQGAEFAERALADGRLSLERDPPIVLMATVALMAAGRLEQAKAVWDRALADPHTPFVGGFARFSRALALVRLGEINPAEADSRRVLGNLGQDPRLALGYPIILTTLVDVLVERGELEGASQLLEEHGLRGELPDIFQTNDLLESRGRLRIAEGRLDEGIADLRECGRRLAAWGIRKPWLVRNPGLIAWRTSLAPALAASGERAEALALAREEIENARAFEVPRELGMALRAAGLVEGGEAGIKLLREAVGVLEDTPAALEHARALTDLGAALRRAGQRSDAREPLRAGLELAQGCGATALAERAHSELVATGARPRRFVLSGVDSLTASERRVAEMASEGLTNREIAQALFVTEKTVEGHLGQTYRKLDIGSRSQLSDALSSAGETVAG